MECPADSRQAEDESPKIARGRDEAAQLARERLVSTFSGDIKGLMARYVWRREWEDDARQEAYAALLEATVEFDPTQGVSFQAYAKLKVKLAIRHFVQRQSRLRDRTVLLEDLVQKYGDEADLNDLELLGVHEPGFEQVDAEDSRAPVPTFVSTLTPLQKQIVRRVFLDDATQVTVAGELDVHPVAINRTLKRVYAKGRQGLADPREVVAAP